jgi:hypothetical protein
VFTYETKSHPTIKIWDIKTLRVYQKVQLSAMISEMKVCEMGLYLVSEKKGYLCYYPFEKKEPSLSKKMPLQILELCIVSNILYIHTNNLLASVVYKLTLANKPTLIEYAVKNTSTDQVLRFAFNRN